jgi:copper(I)-binding protein
MIRYSGLLFAFFIFQAPAWALDASDGWMRAMPPGQPTAAAYLTLRNAGEEPARLVAARAPFAERVELHESSQIDGAWRMRQLDSLTIPPGGSVVLAPGGTHLMLFGLSRQISEGDSLTVTLELDSGESLPVSIEVGPPGGSGPGHHHNH